MIVVAVRVAAVKVPVNVGPAENTKDPAVPVSSVIADAKLAEDGVAKNVAIPVPRPEIPVETGRPVQLVNVPEDGVPRTGVVRVGLVNVLLVNVCVLDRVTISTPSIVTTPAADRASVVSVALPS